MYAKIAEGKGLDELVSLFLSSEKHPALRCDACPRKAGGLSPVLYRWTCLEDGFRGKLLGCEVWTRGTRRRPRDGQGCGREHGTACEWRKQSQERP